MKYVEGVVALALVLALIATVVVMTNHATSLS